MKLLLISILPSLVLVSCCCFGSCLGFPEFADDTTWKEYLHYPSFFTLGDRVFIIGGYHQKLLYRTVSSIGLFPPSSYSYHYAYIFSPKVYTPIDSDLIVEMKKAIENQYEIGRIHLVDRVEQIRAPAPPDAVIRKPMYYVECQGAVYCVAGQTPYYTYNNRGMRIRKTRYYNDVWKSEDGLHWKRILKAGPWQEGLIDYTLQTEKYADEDKNRFSDHKLFVCDGRIWLSGGYNGKYHFKTVWSSADGIHWTREGDFILLNEVTDIYSADGNLYIEGPTYPGIYIVWERKPGGEFKEKTRYHKD
jgi:hypothetical protein